MDKLTLFLLLLLEPDPPPPPSPPAAPAAVRLMPRQATAVRGRRWERRFEAGCDRISA